MAYVDLEINGKVLRVAFSRGSNHQPFKEDLLDDCCAYFAEGRSNEREPLYRHLEGNYQGVDLFENNTISKIDPIYLLRKKASDNNSSIVAAEHLVNNTQFDEEITKFNDLTKFELYLLRKSGLNKPGRLNESNPFLILFKGFVRLNERLYLPYQVGFKEKMSAVMIKSFINSSHESPNNHQKYLASFGNTHIGIVDKLRKPSSDPREILSKYPLATKDLDLLDMGRGYFVKFHQVSSSTHSVPNRRSYRAFFVN